MVLTNFIFIDLDGTIIKTKSGQTFPTDMNDWKLNKKVVDKVSNLVAKANYKIILVTNQAGISKGHSTLDEMKEKIANIEKVLPWSFYEKFIATSFSDVFRKPKYKILVKVLDSRGLKISPLSVMIGDAGDKVKDHSDSDRKFAENLGVQFIHVDGIK